MATNQVYKQGTLLDVMNQRGPDGNHMAVAEILDNATPMFKDAVWVEANDFTQHKYNIRYSLPTSTKIEFNKGASSSLGSTRVEVCTLKGRENRPYVDVRLIKIAADGQAILKDHMHASVEGIGQELETDIIYGSKANGDEYNGLESRLNSLSNPLVYNNGDTGANLSSIYVVAWDQGRGAYLAYPKSSEAGIKFTDEGVRPKDMGDGTVLKVHEMHIEVTCGLCVVDNRSIGRVANIDTGTIGANTFDEHLTIQLLNELPAGLRSKAVMYASRKVKSAMDIRANDKGNAYYTRENVFGSEVLMLHGVPVRLDEQISDAETQVV